MPKPKSFPQCFVNAAEDILSKEKFEEIKKHAQYLYKINIRDFKEND
jgi:hypothetical protein